jgi:uncharacterized protein YsxB (DUF464 family)
MISIVLKETDGHFVSLEAKGHANTAPYGADLVCAAVSAVLLGGFNALKKRSLRSENFRRLRFSQSQEYPLRA